MATMPDLGAAALRVAQLVAETPDELLAAPTPCPRYTVGDLIDHVDGLARAFTAAARKEVSESTVQAPMPDGSRLGPEWRQRIPGLLDALADAWRDPAAWEGMTRIAGGQMPGSVVGRVAVNELVVHGWDIARATGRPYSCDPETVAVAVEFMEPLSAPGQEVVRGSAFGPPVAVPVDAGPLDRLIALNGRDPLWSAKG